MSDKVKLENIMYAFNTYVSYIEACESKIIGFWELDMWKNIQILIIELEKYTDKTPDAISALSQIKVWQSKHLSSHVNTPEWVNTLFQ